MGPIVLKLSFNYALFTILWLKKKKSSLLEVWKHFPFLPSHLVKKKNIKTYNMNWPGLIPVSVQTCCTFNPVNQFDIWREVIFQCFLSICCCEGIYDEFLFFVLQEKSPPAKGNALTFSRDIFMHTSKQSSLDTDFFFLSWLRMTIKTKFAIFVAITFWLHTKKKTFLPNMTKWNILYSLCSITNTDFLSFAI